MTLRLKQFITAYIECALWSSTADGSPEQQEADPNHKGSFDSSFLDLGYTDLDPELQKHVEEQCAEFFEAYNDYFGHNVEQAGHDFWLTRNGHGAGFWDRGHNYWPGDPSGQLLTSAAKPYGTEDWYLNEQKLVAKG